MARKIVVGPLITITIQEVEVDEVDGDEEEGEEAAVVVEVEGVGEEGEEVEEEGGITEETTTSYST